MAGKQRTYDKEYKIQAVKLSKEIGGAKAAAELGIPVDTSCVWTGAAAARLYPAVMEKIPPGDQHPGAIGIWKTSVGKLFCPGAKG